MFEVIYKGTNTGEIFDSFDEAEDFITEQATAAALIESGTREDAGRVPMTRELFAKLEQKFINEFSIEKA